jgi:hypothetical protein
MQSDRYRLPDLWVEFEGTRNAFSRELSRVLRSLPRRVKSVTLGHRSLRFEPRRQEGHKALVVIARFPKERSGMVLFDLRARWRQPPTARGYASAARRLLAPILSVLETRWRSPLSLSVGRATGLVRRLPPVARTYFDRFLWCARLRWEKGCELGRLEWQALYAFSWCAHALRVALAEFDVESLLRDEGVPEATAHELATVYGHCRRFANARDWNPRSGHGVWVSGTRHLPPPGVAGQSP